MLVLDPYLIHINIHEEQHLSPHGRQRDNELTMKYVSRGYVSPNYTFSTLNNTIL